MFSFPEESMIISLFLTDLVIVSLLSRVLLFIILEANTFVENIRVKTSIRLNIFIILILVALLFRASNTTYAQYTQDFESLEKLKELSDFNDWPGKTGPMRDGINLSNYIIPSLSETMEIKKERPFSIRTVDEGNFVIKYKSRWQTKQGNFIEIALNIADSPKDAQEYLPFVFRPVEFLLLGKSSFA